MKDKDLVKLLERSGWKRVRTKGSHMIMKKGSKTIPVPVHKKDMKKGTEHSILKQAGLK